MPDLRETRCVAGCWLITQSYSKMLVQACVVVLLVQLIPDETQASKAERQLIAQLFHPTNYSRNERPAVHVNNAVMVSINLTIHNLVDLDERSQILQTSVWKRYQWIDYRLQWPPEKHGGVKEIHVSADHLWRPDLTLYDDVMTDNKDRTGFYPARITADGTVRWNEPDLLISYCDLNVRYFPFDRQVCNLMFGPWTYDVTQVQISNTTREADLDHFTPNGQWCLLSAPATVHRDSYVSEEAYSSITFELYLKRRPLHYMYNLALPFIFISSLTVMSFYLPPESGEKVSLSVTVMLATTVYLLLVASAMPAQSEHIPLMSLYFGCIIILTAVSTMLNVLVTNLHYRGYHDEHVPDYLWKVVSLFAYVVCMRKSLKKFEKVERKDKETRTSLREQELRKKHSSSMIDTVQTLERMTGHHEAPETGTRWTAVSRVTDRLLMLVYCVITVIITVSLLSQRQWDWHGVRLSLPNRLREC